MNGVAKVTFDSPLVSARSAGTVQSARSAATVQSDSVLKSPSNALVDSPTRMPILKIPIEDRMIDDGPLTLTSRSVNDQSLERVLSPGELRQQNIPSWQPPRVSQGLPAMTSARMQATGTTGQSLGSTMQTVSSLPIDMTMSGSEDFTELGEVPQLSAQRFLMQHGNVPSKTVEPLLHPNQPPLQSNSAVIPTSLAGLLLNNYKYVASKKSLKFILLTSKHFSTTMILSI